MDDINDDDLGFDKNSELGRLFEMLRKARKEQKDYGGDLNDPEVLENIMGDLSKHEEPVSTKEIEQDGLTFVIKEYIVDDKLFKTFEVYGDEDKVDYSTLEDKVREVIGNMDSDAIKTTIDINRDNEPKNNIPLKKQLEKAVKDENYELAIELRDKIDERDKRTAPIIQEINEALANEDIEKSEILLEELKKINNEYY